ncbi:adenylate cyclase [Aureimonas sp. SA4125]|uniref:adenylate/guanylate cyclase domain-containing protein n=1 Tax=Aureimonas sp. SA4125 TaxID=2826993 RepID=UPI001CC4C6DE|nr:adenylate/guanylate cyclase domain-containing protein [Aureimonas sp. SA4125]BDA84276.1 adenylate cyclase [Aureimonas sp. SA4125]
MVAIDGASGNPARIMFEVEHKSELRTALWRFVTLAVFAFSVALEPDGGSHPVHLLLLMSYAATSIMAIGLVALDLYRPWMNWVYVAVDAALVVYLAAEHMFMQGVGIGEAVSTPSLAIAFVLLAHAGLRMRAGTVAAFAAIVSLGTAAAAAASMLFGPNAGLPPLDDLRDAGVRAIAFLAVAVFQVMLAMDIRRVVVTAVSSTSERENLARFFAPSTAERIATDGFQIGLVRREAAVLFVDIRGFTGLAETMSPEDLGVLLALYRNRVVDAVGHWEGTIDKFMGDGVMAVFGLDESRSADAERAFNCACQLVTRLEAWSESRVKAGAEPMAFGIGLHFGPVVGGVVAGGAHGEHTVLGDTVNLAARLQSMCKVLSARLVVSGAVLDRLPPAALGETWRRRRQVEVPGRVEPVDVAFLPSGVLY